MRVFPYRSVKSLYASAVVPLLSLIFMELGLAFWLAWRFMAPGPYRALAAVAMLAVGAVPLALMLAPLFGHHRVTSEGLVLRHGLTRLRLPWDWIGSLEPLEAKIDVLQPLKVSHQVEMKRLVAVFSGRGLVRLTLTEPRDLTIWPSRVCRQVESIVFNVDHRAQFLEAVSAFRPTSRRSSEAASSELAFGPVPRRDSKDLAIEGRGLWFRYGERWAVRDLNLSVASGELFGFVGANGAGKTTTLKMLAGVLLPQKGSVRVFGSELWPEGLEARARLGYAPDEPCLYDRLSGRECLQFLAQLRGLSRREADRAVDSALRFLELEAVAEDLSGSYSLGYRKRLALAAALLGDPPLLVLDEPLNGLDPLSAARLKASLRRLCRERRVSVLFSSHDLSAVEAICDRIGIIDRGSLVAEGSPAELRERNGAPDLETVFLKLVQPGDD